MRRSAFGFLLALPLLVSLSALTAGADEPKRDARLDPPKDYNGYFPWTPPASKERWEKRRVELRQRVLVANGLWPMPEKTPLQPVIHGKIARDGYTIEKVFFASLPGHYVCGNLYRPTSGKADRRPAILSPHGHWAKGRFFEASETEIANQLKIGGEKTREGAKYPLQARCAQLARMGCVVFHYDMVGYADSQQIVHREGFKDVRADLRLQSFMGLQTYNSIRALDFLAGLPDVDPGRIGVTGASGGGTQTFILCGIDDRPAAAFPAVMVSTSMQGGCVCENATYLRVGTGNIELAGLTAPRPLGMTGADDWTKDIETKGYPELRALYTLYGAEQNVMAKCYPQFGHNYNQVSRELMYNFFNKHLKLGQPEPVVEQSFVPIPPRELSVFDAQHPLPKDAVGVEGLRRYLTEAGDKQLEALVPQDAAGLKRLRAVLEPAVRTMLDLPSTEAPDTNFVQTGRVDKGEVQVTNGTVLDGGARVPICSVSKPGAQKGEVIWVHPDGLQTLWQGDTLVPAAQKLVDGGMKVTAVEVFRTGATARETRPTTDMKVGSLKFSGYFYGYNDALLAQRVQDIIATVRSPARDPRLPVHLVGFGKAGPWALLARTGSGDRIARTVVDLNNFRFEQVRDFDDEMMLPGALRYGGLPGLATLAAPGELLLHNMKGAGPMTLLEAAYRSSGQPDKLTRREERMESTAAVEWLLR